MDLSVSLRVVFPLVIFMAVGKVCRLIGILDPGTSGKLNQFCFQVLIPCTMFRSIIDAKDSFGGETAAFVLYMMAFTVALYFLLEVTVSPLAGNAPRAGSIIQGIIQGNGVLFAMAVTESLYAGNAAVIGAASVTVSVLVPLYNVLATVMFERRRAEKKSDVFRRLAHFLVTPLGIMTVLGFVFVLLDVEPPVFLSQAVNSLASCATPLALAIIGADLDMTREKKDMFQLLALCFLKLIAVPLAALLLTRALGFPDMYAAVAVVILFVPTAVSSYPFAVNMGGDGPFSASVIAYTTVLSIFTAVGWITVLQLMGLA